MAGIELSRLHFLVHPGYEGAPHNARGLHLPAETLLKVDREREKIHSDILGPYILKAASLRREEYMVVVTHVPPDDFVFELSREHLYAQTIMSIVKILGNQAQLVFDHHAHLCDNQLGEKNTQRETLVASIRDEIRRRGYRFKPDIQSEAYGEWLTMCVADVANVLNAHLQLTRKTLIRPRLTEYRWAGDDAVAEAIEELREADKDCNQIHANIVFEAPVTIP